MKADISVERWPCTDVWAVKLDTTNNHVRQIKGYTWSWNMVFLMLFRITSTSFRQVFHRGHNVYDMIAFAKQTVEQRSEKHFARGQFIITALMMLLCDLRPQSNQHAGRITSSKTQLYQLSYASLWLCWKELWFVWWSRDNCHFTANIISLKSRL